MRTQRLQWLGGMILAIVLGTFRADGQFTAATKLGSGALGTIRTNGPGSYSAIAGGQDIYSAGDEFTFHNFSSQGTHFDLRVRVQSLIPNAAQTRAGVMVRESSTATNSRMAFVRVTPVGATLNGQTGSNDVRFQYRLGTATPAQGENEDPLVGFPAPAYPNAWVRLERHASIIGGYSSTDGVNWFLLGNQDTATWPAGAMAPVFALGLAQSRGAQGANPTCPVEYRDFTAGANFPPIVSDIPVVATLQGTPTSPIAFTIGDFETPAANLAVTATSSNLFLFPTGSLALGGAGTNRTLVATPAPNAIGSAIITVTVSDGTSTANEQFRINVVGLDFGDAPDRPYPTTLSANGARHIIVPGIFLGARVDAETNGQPNATATGDDNIPTNEDDEDGVRFLTPLVPGQPAAIEVTASVAGRLDAWIDFDGNGSWADAADRIFASRLLAPGPNTLTIVVPSTAKVGTTFSRFRFSLQGDLNFIGLAPNGEVEDYQVTIADRPLDFGDAPASYGTLLANDGARHLIQPGFYLGAFIDSEPDGQPSPDALGDDTPGPGGVDDEDGVTFIDPLAPGQPARVEVVASSEGRLDAWMDFNASGTFNDPGDQIFASVPLVPGVNTLSFNIPSTAAPRPTFARFRLSRQGGLKPTGLAPDGEVEDYRVNITRPGDCDRTCTGTNFWLTFPGNYAPDPANPVRLTLCIIGPGGTPFQVEVPGLGFSVALTIPPGGAALLAVPKDADLGDDNDVVSKKGIHVSAGAPVSVQGLNHVRFTSDGFLGLPTEVLGNEYLIGAYGNVHTGAPDLNGSQFAVAACEDNTRVRITPRIAVGSHPANAPFFVVLQAGETYQLRATNDAPDDLTGTVVEADHPVAVFGGHRCAQVPSGDQWFCDYLVEQLIPVQSWGRVFVTAPLATRLKGDTFRILAATDKTDVFIGGNVVATLDRGEYHQALLATGAVITASQPVSVMQYANSSDFDLVTQSDPFMVVVPPIIMFNNQHVVCTAPVDFTAHYLNVIAPAASVGSLTADGAVVPVAAFTQITGSPYFYAQLPVAAGVHSVAAPQPVAVTVYGWSEYDGYGYPGCLAFGDTTPPVVTCLISNVTITLGTPGTTLNCEAQVPDLREQVQFSDNCGLSPNAVPRQVPVPGTPIGPGDHPVTISVSDARGNVGSCVITVTVVDPTPPLLQCSNLVAHCTTPTGGVVNFSVDAHTLCGSPLPASCTPVSGSFFAEGVTPVTCSAVNGEQTASCTFTVTVRCDRIQVSNANGTVVLTWADGTLESAPTVNGPWAEVPNAKSPFIVNTGTSIQQRFFRLKL